MRTCSLPRRSETSSVSGASCLVGHCSQDHAPRVSIVEGHDEHDASRKTDDGRDRRAENPSRPNVPHHGRAHVSPSWACTVLGWLDPSRPARDDATLVKPAGSSVTRSRNECGHAIYPQNGTHSYFTTGIDRPARPSVVFARTSVVVSDGGLAAL